MVWREALKDQDRDHSAPPFPSPFFSFLFCIAFKAHA